MTGEVATGIAVHMEDQESTNTVLCPSCGGRMALVRVLPRTGPYPELRTFRCTPCGEVETKTVSDPGTPIPARWPSPTRPAIHL